VSIAFQKDIFSSGRPSWIKAEAALLEVVDQVSDYFPDDFLPLTSVPMYSSALEINSRNIKVVCKGSNLLLKRWPYNSKIARVNELLKLMQRLPSKKLPVPSPINFKNGSLVLDDGESLWSLYPFIEGDYFSGIKNELEAVATTTALLTLRLQELDNQNFSQFKSLHHLTDVESATLVQLEKHKDSWERFFGCDNAELLKTNWVTIKNEWNRLSEENVFAGPVQLAHCDLHPHNILMRDNKVAAILDFDGCAKTSIGYAVAYGALKQCKQALVASGNAAQARKVGRTYIRIIDYYIPSSDNWTSNFYDLAITETLRRLCLIFRLNLDQSDATWNHVLPVLIAHIEEAKLLFQPSSV